MARIFDSITSDVHARRPFLYKPRERGISPVNLNPSTSSALRVTEGSHKDSVVEGDDGQQLTVAKPGSSVHRTILEPGWSRSDALSSSHSIPGSAISVAEPEAQTRSANGLGRVSEPESATDTGEWETSSDAIAEEHRSAQDHSLTKRRYVKKKRSRSRLQRTKRFPVTREKSVLSPPSEGQASKNLEHRPVNEQEIVRLTPEKWGDLSESGIVAPFPLEGGQYVFATKRGLSSYEFAIPPDKILRVQAERLGCTVWDGKDSIIIDDHGKNVSDLLGLCNGRIRNLPSSLTSEC